MAEIIIKKEDKPDLWYRNSFDREKDAILLPIVSRDLGIITGTQVRKTKKGFVGKREIYCASCPITPKTFGNMKGHKRTAKQKYMSLLKEHFEKGKETLNKFKEKEQLFLYVRIYLREKKFTRNDLDNYIKVLVDSLKEFIGDDSRIVSIQFDKVNLKGIDPQDADFFEQSIIFISTPDAKKDLFKKPRYCFDFLGMINNQKELKIKGELTLKRK